MRLPATPQRRSLATRLLVAQGVVVAAAILTAALVATFVGPPLFHEHLVEAGHPAGSPELDHIEQAYTSANTIALGAALLIALTAGVAVTWYVARRVTEPLTDLADAASRLSRGDYSARVRARSGGLELEALADTFDHVAERLQTTEDTRRRLLADLAHEMRTPLATIEAYLDGLEDGVAAWDDETARVLRDQTRRLVRLSQDLGEVSNAEEGRLDLRLRSVDVAELIATATSGLQAEYAGKGVTLDASVLQALESAGSHPVVEGDRQRLLQLLTNLLTNALRHTSAGGKVSVTARHTDGMVSLEVADTGDGIPADQLAHVFERFYRGDTARDRDSGGSGIGLTIARSIARAHHGTLTAQSAGVGQGTTLRLTLPLADASTPPP